MTNQTYDIKTMLDDLKEPKVDDLYLPVGGIILYEMYDVYLNMTDVDGYFTGMVKVPMQMYCAGEDFWMYKDKGNKALHAVLDKLSVTYSYYPSDVDCEPEIKTEAYTAMVNSLIHVIKACQNET